MHGVVNLALIYSWGELKLKYLSYVNFVTESPFLNRDFRKMTQVTQLETWVFLISCPIK